MILEFETKKSAKRVAFESETEEEFQFLRILHQAFHGGSISVHVDDGNGMVSWIKGRKLPERSIQTTEANGRPFLIVDRT